MVSHYRQWNSLSYLSLEMMTVVGWRWPAVSSPPATHPPLCNSTGGENKLKMFVAQDQDREITYPLPPRANPDPTEGKLI